MIPITVPEIDKLFPGSNKRASACQRAVILPGTASIPYLMLSFEKRFGPGIKLLDEKGKSKVIWAAP